jgi:hypothetical protein
MVARWTFDHVQDQTVLSSSANRFDGLLVGDANAISDPDRGSVLSLDGAGDFMFVGPVTIDGNSPRTIAGWAKADTKTMKGGTGVFGFTRYWREYHTHFDIECGGKNSYVIHLHGWERELIPVDLKWHHLAATYDGARISWYADGRLVGTEFVDIDTTDLVQIGKRANNNKCFSGLIDDVRIYNYALSAEEIRQVMVGAGPGANH